MGQGRQGVKTLTLQERWTCPEYALTIKKWAAEGLTIKQIAEKVGVSRTTFYKWRKDNPILEKMLTEGTEEANRKVEKSLFLRAIGYDYEQISYKNVYDPVTREYRWIEDKKEIKHQPPDTTALMFWLRNKEPEIFRYGTPRELNGIQGHPAYNNWEKWKDVDWESHEYALSAQHRELERMGQVKKKKKK